VVQKSLILIFASLVSWVSQAQTQFALSPTTQAQLNAFLKTAAQVPAGASFSDQYYNFVDGINTLINLNPSGWNQPVLNSVLVDLSTAGFAYQLDNSQNLGQVFLTGGTSPVGQALGNLIASTGVQIFAGPIDLAYVQALAPGAGAETETLPASKLPPGDPWAAPSVQGATIVLGTSTFYQLSPMILNYATATISHEYTHAEVNMMINNNATTSLNAELTLPTSQLTGQVDQTPLASQVLSAVEGAYTTYRADESLGYLTTVQHYNLAIPMNTGADLAGLQSELPNQIGYGLIVAASNWYIYQGMSQADPSTITIQDYTITNGTASINLQWTDPKSGTDQYVSVDGLDPAQFSTDPTGQTLSAMSTPVQMTSQIVLANGIATASDVFSKQLNFSTGSVGLTFEESADLVQIASELKRALGLQPPPTIGTSEAPGLVDPLGQSFLAVQGQFTLSNLYVFNASIYNLPVGIINLPGTVPGIPTITAAPLVSAPSAPVAYVLSDGTYVGCIGPCVIPDGALPVLSNGTLEPAITSAIPSVDVTATGVAAVFAMAPTNVVDSSAATATLAPAAIDPNAAPTVDVTAATLTSAYSAPAMSNIEYNNAQAAASAAIVDAINSGAIGPDGLTSSQGGGYSIISGGGGALHDICPWIVCPVQAN
jgi:hypothetical protein